MGQRANHGDRHRGVYARDHQPGGTYIEICSCGYERVACRLNIRTKGLTDWMPRNELAKHLKDTLSLLED